MPGLLRGVARTAVVAGTATAVSGRVQRRQATRFAERDAQAAGQRQEADQQPAAPAYAPEPQQAPAPPSAGADRLEQLKQLGQLKADGVLTDEEFAAEKARLLAG